MGDGEEVIREVWGRWNAGVREYDVELLDPEIEIHSALTGQVFEGEDGITHWIAEIDDQFEAWNLSIDEIEQTSADRFVAHGSVRARGRQSGVDLDQPITWTVEIRDGRILQVINRMGREAE